MADAEVDVTDDWQHRRRRAVAAAVAIVAAVAGFSVSAMMAWHVLQRSRRVSSPEVDYELLPNQAHQFDFLLRRPEKFRILCRLTPNEAVTALNLMGYDHPLVRTGRWKYSPMHRFMVYLMCLADSTRFQRLSNDKGWSVDSVWKCMNHFTTLVQLTIGRDARYAVAGWTALEQVEWNRNPPAIDLPRCIGIVDGWYLRINKPRKASESRKHWSQYKQYHAILYLIIVDRTGRIRAMTRGHAPGHTCEAAVLRHERLMLHPQLKLMGDGAYTNDHRVLIPFAKNQLRAQAGVSNADKLAFNLMLRRQRVLVEWTIGRLRQTWHILHTPFRIHRERADDIVNACAVLLNFMYTQRGTFTLRTPEQSEALANQMPVQADDLIEPPD